MQTFCGGKANTYQMMDSLFQEPIEPFLHSWWERLPLARSLLQFPLHNALKSDARPAVHARLCIGPGSTRNVAIQDAAEGLQSKAICSGVHRGKCLGICNFSPSKNEGLQKYNGDRHEHSNVGRDDERDGNADEETSSCPTPKISTFLLKRPLHVQNIEEFIVFSTTEIFNVVYIFEEDDTVEREQGLGSSSEEQRS